VARTAVIAGTATAVSNTVTQKQMAGAAAKHQQQAAAEAEKQAAANARNELDAVRTQLAGLQAQQLETAAVGETGTMMAHLQQLAQLKEAGMLTDEEFAAAKNRLLAG
jgi:hypothetical protein